jgi:hypothetical protein
MPAGGALIDYGKRYGLPSYNISAAQASDSGLTILEHIYLSGGLDTLCWAPAGNVARCRTIADHLRRNGTWFVPTIIGSFAEPIDPKITAPHARGVYDRWRRQLAAFRNGPIPHGNWLRDSADTKPDQAAGAMAAIQQTPDFPLLAGTAGATHWISLYRSRPLASGFALHAELAMYVAEGLTPLRALQAATLNPAKLLHATDSLGTVAPGKLADLVLLDANPLDDITNTTAIRAVVADGRYYDRAALDQLWEKAKALAHEKKLETRFP